MQIVQRLHPRKNLLTRIDFEIYFTSYTDVRKRINPLQNSWGSKIWLTTLFKQITYLYLKMKIHHTSTSFQKLNRTKKTDSYTIYQKISFLKSIFLNCKNLPNIAANTWNCCWDEINFWEQKNWGHFLPKIFRPSLPYSIYMVNTKETNYWYSRNNINMNIVGEFFSKNIFWTIRKLFFSNIYFKAIGKIFYFSAIGHSYL